MSRSQRRRYVVGTIKIPHRDRDVARDVLGATGESREFFDVIGADTRDDDDQFPLGADCTYAADLTPAEAARLRCEGECSDTHGTNVRYVEPETYAAPAAPDTVPRPSMRTWMGHSFPELPAWTGTDVPIAIVDSGTSSTLRTYMNYTLSARQVFNTADPPSGDVYDGIPHGCQVASLAIPTGGQLVDAFISDRNANYAGSRTAAGVKWAADQGAKLFTFSFVWSTDTSYVSPMTDALNYLAGFDAVVFAAAGNDGVSGLRYPASAYSAYSWVHPVMAFTSYQGVLASYSNYTTDPLVGAAPGSAVAVVGPDGAEVSANGTSLAAPNALQQCARIMTGGRFSAREAATALRASYRDTGQPVQGGGAYDLRRALTLLGAIAPPPELRRAVSGAALSAGAT